MAFDRGLTLEVCGVARRVIDAFYKERVCRMGPPGQHDDAQAGSIMDIQRLAARPYTYKRAFMLAMGTLAMRATANSPGC
ncbi:MAG: hypothetical protein R3B40_18590 [Polyangiales bacterium]|nr:hypothetical protein [Myxococcales bacterium]MCB9657732.1 hypothetical protein [Sandaracinaceae bacterium]